MPILAAMRYALAAAIFALAVPASAEGLPVPAHDVDATCASLRDRQLIAQCVREEQYQFNYITAVWANLFPAYQRKCTEFAKDQGEGYYAYYRSLGLFVGAQLKLQQMDADKILPPPRFQR